MNYLKSLFAALLLMSLFTTMSHAQEKQKNMMQDSSKTHMMKDKMMKKDHMKKDSMMKDEKMMKGEEMKGDKMMQDKGMMKEDNMKKDMMDHDKMMMQIDKNDNGVAINGYDPVAYFTDSKAMMGDAMHSYSWGGAEWHFASKEHLSMFKGNPEKYAPKYGGYCAYGLGAANGLFSSDPTAWTIKDGKLYLNKNSEVKNMFKKDLNGNIMKAEKNWMGMNKKDKM